jgi:hypothetical protein
VKTIKESLPFWQIKNFGLSSQDLHECDSRFESFCAHSWFDQVAIFSSVPAHMLAMTAYSVSDFSSKWSGHL